MTPYVREEDRVRTLSAGYEMHVKKPVEPYTLAEAVAAWENAPARTKSIADC